MAPARSLAEVARKTPPVVVDAVLTIVCYLTIAIYAVLNSHEWWVVVLAAGNALPLLWRRQYPFAVTAVVSLGTMWLAMVDALGDFAPAQLVATYTFAAMCPPAKRLIAATFTAIGVTMSIVIPGDDILNLGPNVIMFTVAYALGTSARARRDRIAMLEERARRLTEEQGAVATREREKIARDMHDILAHSMSLVIVQAEAGPVAVRTDPDKAEEVFDTISVTARDALAQLRRVLGVLRSDGPVRQPLPSLDSLPALIADARETGLTIRLDVEGEPIEVPPDLSATGYRIVQESLTNTLKHAGAGHAWVKLAWHDRTLSIEVRDDGQGSTDRREPSGHGLVGMRERVTAVGGDLSFGSDLGGVGFRVAARLPIE
jgi:signal transduction histidine kinase